MPIHTEDLEYLRVGGTPLLARFYRPEGPGPFPAVLEVHGGAWTSGDRFNNVAIAEHLAAHGIVARATGRDALAEEMPEAYKDVKDVVGVVHDFGISTRVARLRPIGVIKG